MKETYLVYPDNKELHLKKGKYFGWRVIHPIRNKDGKINWKNLVAGGSWWKLLLVIFIVTLMILFMLEYVGNLKICNEVLNNMSTTTQSFTNIPLY